MTELTALRRQAELKGEAEGEKILTRHVLDQLRQNTDVVLELQRQLAAQAQKLDKIGDAVA